MSFIEEKNIENENSTECVFDQHKRMLSK